MLGQPNLVHIPTSHLLEIHPNIIHPSTPRSPGTNNFQGVWKWVVAVVQLVSLYEQLGNLGSEGLYSSVKEFGKYSDTYSNL